MNANKLFLVLLIVGAVIALPFINRAVLGTDAKEVTVANLSQRVISPSILASGFLATIAGTLSTPWLALSPG